MFFHRIEAVGPGEVHRHASDAGSDSVTIDNTGPRITDVAITPDTGVRQDTTLTCEATAEDADGEVPSIALVWDVDSAIVGSGDTLELSSILPDAGALVTCTATATDGHGDTDTATDSVTVDNTPPEINDDGEGEEMHPRRENVCLG